MKMSRILSILLLICLLFILSACGETDNPNNSNVVPNSSPEEQPLDIDTPGNEAATVDNGSEERPSESQYGNTSGNISNDAFTAQDGVNLYYVLPTSPEYVMEQGELIKINADGSVTIDLSSNGRPHSLNVVDGWIYYISGNSMNPDGLIYKIREDGTENTLITSADSGQGFSQGYTTQNIGNTLRIIVVDDWIYCRVYEAVDDGRYNVIYRINADSGAVERLQQVGASMHGLAVYDGWIYYSTGSAEQDELGTYRMRTDGTDNSKIAEVLIPFPSIVNNKIYYIGGERYIYSMKLDGTSVERVADGIMAVSLNVDGDWIYYATGSEVCKVKTDGTENTKLCDYPSTDSIQINVLNDWIYLMDRASGMYKVKTDGSELQEVV